MNDKLLELETRLKELIMEGHCLLKDIKLEHKEIKITLNDWKVELDNEMTEYLKKEFNIWGDELPAKLKEIENRIYRRFDVMTKNILGAKTSGALTIEELAQLHALMKRA